jgi:hypothetical protein
MQQPFFFIVVVPVRVVGVTRAILRSQGIELTPVKSERLLQTGLCGREGAEVDMHLT